MGFSGLTRILLGKPGEHKGQKGKGKIPTDELIPKNRLCRNQLLMAFQIPKAGTNDYLNDTGYPHDGRADKDSYPHDGRADKDSYPHDRHNQYIMLS